MKSLTYVAFGDSLTYGYGVDASVSFTERLKEYLPKTYPQVLFKIINSGVNGDTTREGLYRLKTDVLDYKPDVVTMLFGSNDSALSDYQHRSTAEYKENYGKIIEKLIKNEAEIILITPPPVIEDSLFPFILNKKLSEYVEIVKELSDKYNLRLIDFNRKLSEKADKLSEYLQYDGVHLSNEGYDVIFELIKAEFQKIL